MGCSAQSGSGSLIAHGLYVSDVRGNLAVYACAHVNLCQPINITTSVILKKRFGSGSLIFRGQVEGKRTQT